MAFKLGDFTATNAFFWSDVSLAVYAGDDVGSTPYSLLLIDSAGKTASGFIGAAGAGEVATDILTDGAFENWISDTNLTSWAEAIAGSSTVNKEGTVKHGGNYSCRFDVDASASNAQIVSPSASPLAITPLGLYRLSLWYMMSVAVKQAKTQLFNTGPNVYLTSAGLWSANATLTLANVLDWTKYELYFNGHASYTAYRTTIARVTASCSVYFDDFKIENISEPPSTGVHIVSSNGGSTRAWTNIDSGFNPATITSRAVLLNGVPIGWGGQSLNLGIKL